MVRLGLVVVTATLLLVACGGESPGERPQQYQIDQDINASRGTSVPTSINPGTPAYDTWRRDRGSYP